MVVEVVEGCQQVTNSQTISVLQSHVRTQTITTGRQVERQTGEERGRWRQTDCFQCLNTVLHVISDEASQRSDGQIIFEDDDAVLKLVSQSGRSEQ